VEASRGRNRRHRRVLSSVSAPIPAWLDWQEDGMTIHPGCGAMSVLGSRCSKEAGEFDRLLIIGQWPESMSTKSRCLALASSAPHRRRSTPEPGRGEFGAHEQTGTSTVARLASAPRPGHPRGQGSGQTRCCAWLPRQVSRVRPLEWTPAGKGMTLSFGSKKSRRASVGGREAADEATLATFSGRASRPAKPGAGGGMPYHHGLFGRGVHAVSTAATWSSSVRTQSVR